MWRDARLRRLLYRSRTALSETASVAAALLYPRPVASAPAARGALLGLHRNGGNSVAASLLRFDQEVGLVRYHGLRGYLLRRYPSGSLSALLGGGGGELVRWRRFLYGTGGGGGGGGGGGTDGSPPSGRPAGGAASSADERGSGSPGPTPPASDGGGNGGDPVPAPKRARVAFMITASQRAELTSALGYGADDVRRLRPLEALLILEHGLPPGSDEALRRLVRENEELERAEAEAAATALKEERRRREREEEEGMAAGMAAGTAAEASADAERGGDSAAEDAVGARDRISLAGAASATESPRAGGGGRLEGGTWFEVIERHSGGEGHVVALYRTEEEARDCADWKRGRASLALGAKGAAAAGGEGRSGGGVEGSRAEISYEVRRRS